jgi:hypothetical protein
MKVKFLKSPTGALKMGYHIGDVAVFTAKVGAELVRDGFAEEIKEPKKRRAKKA